MRSCRICGQSEPTVRIRPQLRTCRVCERAAIKVRQQRARRFVQKVRARIPCALCGARGAIEWHNPSHESRPLDRVGNLASVGYPVKRIAQEMRASAPFCRRCHMKHDGRSARLSANRPFKKGDTQPPRPCRMCSRLYRPLRRGLCNSCYKKERVHAALQQSHSPWAPRSSATRQI